MIERLTAALADHYRIERELGAGGMATVYLAHDLKHDRDVAIKVLHPDLGAALGGERFLSEIRTTARLQHPHILPLLDSGDADGLLYYVMPVVTGETLRARIEREHQLPIPDAVRIAREVASALDYAHRQGVIHRDIKPENILLHDGQALVADFGIALAVQSAGGQRMTQTGLSLGTPQYMSPEQAMGEKQIDARTDVYALGAVTYEMLAGDAPFTGSSVQAIVAKVMNERPTPLHTLRDTVPPNVEQAVVTALAKLPADRFATAAQFAEALVAPSLGTGAIVHAAGSTWLQRHAVPVVTALGILAIAASTLVVRTATKSAPSAVSRFAVSVPTAAKLVTAVGTLVAWTPDARAIIYVGTGPGGAQLWQRSLDALAPTPIVGTDGASSPFLSPDGSQVAYLTVNPFSVQVVPRAGGRPTMVVSGPRISGGGAAWSSDGYIYYDGGSSLSRVRPDGTGVEVVSPLDTLQQEVGVAWPDALPEGRGILFRLRRNGEDFDKYTIVVVDLKTKKRKTLTKGLVARYAPSGHLLFVTADGALMSQRFDLDRLELSGTPVMLWRGLGLGGFGAADVAISSNGALLYSVGGATSMTEPTWVSRDGTNAPVDPAWHDALVNSFALSPDGKNLALQLVTTGMTNLSQDIWVKRIDGGGMPRLTFDGTVNRRPSWSHDGRDVLFLSNRKGPYALYRQRADGSSPATLLVSTATGLGEGFESPDGRWLVLMSDADAPGLGDIMAMQVGVDTVPRPIIATRFHELGPSLSPDGHWLAYGSDEGGRFEVFVRPFPEVNSGKFQVSAAGGHAPRWSHGGDELFYINAAGDMMSAKVSRAPTFSVMSQQRLFSALKYSPSRPHRAYDVTPDDHRFLMMHLGPSASNAENPLDLVLVQNFLEELKRLVPR